MKAKYARKKNFKNASETFIYNTDKYCEIIAKKFGKEKKQAKEYFDKFFKFLDDRKLLTDSVKARLNKNIKTFILSYADSQSMGAGVMGYYLPSENSITLNKAYNYNKENVLIHEFIHLLTSSHQRFDEKRLDNVFAFGKKAKNYSSNIGYINVESSTANIEYSVLSGNFNEDDVRYFLTSTFKFIDNDQLGTANSWFQQISGKSCIAFKSFILGQGGYADKLFSIPQSVDKEKEREKKKEIDRIRRQREKERDLKRDEDREKKQREKRITEYYSTNSSDFKKYQMEELDFIPNEENLEQVKVEELKDLSLNEIIERFVEKTTGRLQDESEIEESVEGIQLDDETVALIQEEAPEISAKIGELIASVVDQFIADTKNKPFDVCFAIDEQYVISINYNGKDNYYLEAYYCDNPYESDIAESCGRNFTEGMTEFVARHFASYESKSNYLSNCAYNTLVKYAEMLYKIYGDALLETFFEQSKISFARLTNSTIEEVNTFFDNIDNLFDYAMENKNAYHQVHQDTMTFIYDRLTEKISTEIVENLHAFDNCREIDHCIQQSLLEFSKSLYFGWDNNTLQETRIDILNELAIVYADIIEGLKTFGESEEVVNFYGWEGTSKLTSLKETNFKKLENFYSDANFACDNSYFFTNKDLKEIRPTDYVNNKTITTYNNNNQEYLRKKAKFPTTYQIHLTHHIQEF